jgi:multidrug transporter EmrE-like cation transporter
VVAGVIFSFISAVLINSGNVVQKHSVGAMSELSARHSGRLIQTLASSRPWMIGFALCLAGVALQVLAFALAPISVVQSIFNAGIVGLVLFSRLKLGEQLQRLEWFGLGIVIVSLVSMSASLNDAAGAVGTGGTGLGVVVAVAPTILVTILVIAAIRTDRWNTGFLYGTVAGLLYGAAALGTKGASTLVDHYGVVAGIPHILTSLFPYIFIVCSVLGMLMYQTGLQRYRISVVGSMTDVVCSTYLVIVGSIVFGEHLPSDPVTLTLRLAGFVGVLVGSILVAVGSTSGGEDGETMMVTEADMGLGPVLAAEVASVTGHTADDLITGAHAHLHPGED